jgi:hypothetical protein
VTPELIGIIALFGSIVALAVALFGSLKWVHDRLDNRLDNMGKQIDKRFDDVERRMDSRFDSMDRRFERVEADISSLKEGLARLEGMFEGAFERIPRTRPETPEEGSSVAAPSGGRVG